MTLDLYRKLNYLEREEQSSEKGQTPSLQSVAAAILFGIGCSTVAECMPHDRGVVGSNDTEFCRVVSFLILSFPLFPNNSVLSCIFVDDVKGI